MNNFFAKIYELTIDAYGYNLTEYLYGNGEGMSTYVLFGLIQIGISLSTVLIFYYIMNRPDFNRWYNWALIGFANIILQFGFVVLYLNIQLQNGVLVVDGVGLYEITMFSLTAIVPVALIQYIIFSFMLRWWSTNCSTTPYPQ